MKSSATTPAITASHSGQFSTFKTPQPFLLIAKASPTAPVGNKVLTRRVFRKVIAMFANHRLGLFVMSWRLGEITSQEVITVKTRKKPVRRIKPSISIIFF